MADDRKHLLLISRTALAVLILGSTGVLALDRDNEPARPQVEVFIPSMSALVDAAGRSSSGTIYRAMAGLVALPADETGEGFDVAILPALLEKISGWPNTSVGMTTYTQDRDGRARWAIKVDWPLDDLVGRI